jgi:hypothetical protein
MEGVRHDVFPGYREERVPSLMQVYATFLIEMNRRAVDLPAEPCFSHEAI